MADYYQHQDRAERSRTRVHPRARGEHAGMVLTGVAVLMLGALALLWTSQQSVQSPLPQPAAAVSQPVLADEAPVPVVAAPVVLRAAPAVAPPSSYAVGAAGDTRAVQP